ncbi:MAG: hypothetical protein J6A28_00100 [Clostridia bacterium]|nr:hypothetical protein [Clostridia bacterium]
MKGFLKKLVITTLVASTIFTLAACGNDNTKNEDKRYVVIEENDSHVLHQYDLSQTVGMSSKFHTTCCNEEIRATNYTGYLKNKPPRYAYDMECGQEAEQ